MFEFKNIDSPASALFDLTKEYGSGEPKSDAPLKRIFQIVLAQDCKTVLVESDHEDEEWKSEHSIFYSKLFKNYPNKTKRLHFFKSEVKEVDLCRLSELQTSYLGFCVLRPTKTQKVANALIAPMKDKNEPPKSFVLCQEDFPVEVNTNNNVQHLTVRGFPFVQQDGNAACCAHVALIMADRFLVQHKNKQTGKQETAHLVSEIVDFVSSVPTVLRRSPASATGLGPLEIAEALRKMGYVPLVYYFDKNTKSLFPLERVIYHYLESKIPIYVSIATAEGRHALTIIGHSFQPDTWWALAETEYYSRRPSGGNYHCSTDWIPNFVAHDDNFGPYLIIPKEFFWMAEADRGLSIVVPLPYKIPAEEGHSEKTINMTGEHAEFLANSLFESMAILGGSGNQAVSDETESWAGILREHYKRRDLVLRTCLLTREEFKNKYVPPHLAPYYEIVRLPKTIWLTEVSIPELFSHARLRLGEIIMDPTEPIAIPAPFLSIHTPGRFIIKDPDSEQPPDEFIITDDPPHKHIIRG